MATKKIYLKNIYDDFAKQALFYDYVKDSVEDIDDYDSKSKANVTTINSQDPNQLA